MRIWPTSWSRWSRGRWEVALLTSFLKGHHSLLTGFIFQRCSYFFLLSARVWSSTDVQYHWSWYSQHLNLHDLLSLSQITIVRILIIVDKLWLMAHLEIGYISKLKQLYVDLSASEWFPLKLESQTQVRLDCQCIVSLKIHQKGQLETADILLYVWFADTFQGLLSRIWYRTLSWLQSMLLLRT